MNVSRWNKLFYQSVSEHSRTTVNKLQGSYRNRAVCENLLGGHGEPRIRPDSSANMEADYWEGRTPQ